MSGLGFKNLIGRSKYINHTFCTSYQSSKFETVLTAFALRKVALFTISAADSDTCEKVQLGATMKVRELPWIWDVDRSFKMCATYPLTNI